MELLFLLVVLGFVLVFVVSYQRNHFLFSSGNPPQKTVFLVFHQKCSRNAKTPLVVCLLPKIHKFPSFVWFFNRNPAEIPTFPSVLCFPTKINKAMVSLRRNQETRKNRSKPKPNQSFGPHTKVGDLLSSFVGFRRGMVWFLKNFLLPSTGTPTL